MTATLNYKLGRTVEQIIEDSIDIWLKRSTGKEFSLWANVSCAFRTGLCAKCVSEDSSENENCKCRSKKS